MFVHIWIPLSTRRTQLHWFVRGFIISVILAIRCLFADINECIEAKNNRSACPIIGQLCTNAEGSFLCTCPPLTEEVNGTCAGKLTSCPMKRLLVDFD